MGLQHQLFAVEEHNWRAEESPRNRFRGLHQMQIYPPGDLRMVELVWMKASMKLEW